jgi:hypothetical protein
MKFHVLNNGNFELGINPFNVEVEIKGAEELGDAFIQDFVPKFKTQLKRQFKTRTVLADYELDNMLLESEYGMPYDIQLQEELEHENF